MSRRHILTWAPILWAAAWLGCSSEPGLDERSFVGLQQSEVRAELGEPDTVGEMTKTAEHVFGPIEDIWYRIETGDKIVTWIYESRTGRKELYFINDDTEVAGEFFWYHDQSKNPVF